jgi:hypothetical protein
MTKNKNVRCSCCNNKVAAAAGHKANVSFCCSIPPSRLIVALIVGSASLDIIYCDQISNKNVDAEIDKMQMS